jgi:hypothetical protein
MDTVTSFKVWHDSSPSSSVVQANLEAADSQAPVSLKTSPWSGRWRRMTFARFAVTACRPDAASMVILERIHTQLQQRWHGVIEEVLRIRRGATGRSLYRSPILRRHDMLAFSRCWSVLGGVLTK